MSAAAPAASAFWLAADDEERRARSLPVFLARDSSGERVSPGDEVVVDIAGKLVDGVVHAGRAVIRSGPTEYRDLEVETSEGRRVPFRSHTTTKRKPGVPRGMSEPQWKVILRLQRNTLTKVGEEWNTSPTPGESIHPLTVRSMTSRGWLEPAGAQNYRLTNEANELGRLAQAGMMEKS